jgi:DNA-directed RNA polymerase subunit RPC12/RpoP
MAYYCRDCSYRGKQGSQFGGCPACGSQNMVLDRPSAEVAEAAPGKPRLVVLAAVWAVFLGLVAWKLIG